VILLRERRQCPQEENGNRSNHHGLSPTLNAQSMVVVDFNGDGKPDLAAVNQNSNSVTILTNSTP